VLIASECYLNGYPVIVTKMNPLVKNNSNNIGDVKFGGSEFQNIGNGLSVASALGIQMSPLEAFHQQIVQQTKVTIPDYIVEEIIWYAFPSWRNTIQFVGW